MGRPPTGKALTNAERQRRSRRKHRRMVRDLEARIRELEAELARNWRAAGRKSAAKRAAAKK